MQRRRLRGPRRVTMVTVRIGLMAGLMAGLVAGCGSDGNDDTLPAILPAESIEQALLTASEGTTVIVPTSPPPTTAVISTTTVAAPIETAAVPTVVETLPQPAKPPTPRGDEPYVELGTIEIPKLGIAQKLLEGITLNTLDQAPGHWPGTAMPGKLGNVVIAGHRTSHGKEFRHIDELGAGDEVILTTTDGRFVYVVNDVVVVQPNALYIVEQTEARTATLFACHPPGSTRQRIVVHLTLQVGSGQVGTGQEDAGTSG